MLAMLSRKNIYRHIAEALADRLQDDCLVELGMDHNRLFLRLGGQIFAIQVEEKTQFRVAADSVTAARNFMATLPVPFRSEG
jgi:hypothetical protein